MICVYRELLVVLVAGLFLAVGLMVVVNNPVEGGLATKENVHPAMYPGGGGGGSSPTQIMYFSYNDACQYGNIYEQYWAYLGPNGNHIYWRGTISVTSENGSVLDGNYNWWSVYDVVGETHKTGTIDFNSPDSAIGNSQSIYAFTPPNTVSSGSAETVTFGLSGSAGYYGVTGGATISWQMYYPEFEQTTTSLTATNGGWAFYDNQALNGPNPTATSFSAGVTVPTVYNSCQTINADSSMNAMTSSWGWDTVYTYSISNNLQTEWVS